MEKVNDGQMGAVVVPVTGRPDPYDMSVKILQIFIEYDTLEEKFVL